MHDGFAPNRGDGDRSKRMRPNPAQEQNHPRIGTSSSHSQLLFGNNDGYLRNDGVTIHDGSDDLVDNGNVESWNGDQYLAKKQPVDCYSASPLHRASSGIGGSGGPWPLNLSPHNGLGVMPNPSPVSAVGLAGTALEMLNAYCAESGWTWLDGMLLGGCLAYVCTHLIGIWINFVDADFCHRDWVIYLELWGGTLEYWRRMKSKSYLIYRLYFVGETDISFLKKVTLRHCQI